MNKNLMLFVWFLKFGLFKQPDEYNLHDSVKARFCPEYIPDEEFDEKEQILRDTPGPAGIKYAFYIGGKVGGLPGMISAVAGLLVPVIAIAVVIALAYEPFVSIDMLKVSNEGGENNIVLNGMYASALGLIIAHLYKIIYFNHVRKKALIFILPAAAVFILINALLADREISVVLMPFYLIAVVGFGALFGAIHVARMKYREKHPKYINPYSKKAIKMRDRQLREEEEQMRKYIDDDTIKRRREQLEKERLEEEERKRKLRGRGDD